MAVSDPLDGKKHDAPEVVSAAYVDLARLSVEEFVKLQEQMVFFCLEPLYHYVSSNKKPLIDFDLVDQFLSELPLKGIRASRFMFDLSAAYSTVYGEMRSLVAMHTTVAPHFEEWLTSTEFRLTVLNGPLGSWWRVKIANTSVFVDGRVSVGAVKLALPYSENWHCTVGALRHLTPHVMKVANERPTGPQARAS